MERLAAMGVLGACTLCVHGEEEPWTQRPGAVLQDADGSTARNMDGVHGEDEEGGATRKG
jgi:hypothetical protein